MHLHFLVTLENKEFKIGLIVPGNLRKFKGLGMVNPAGKQIRHKIDLITFYLSEYKLNLSDIYYQIIEFITEIEIHIENKSSAQHMV